MVDVNLTRDHSIIPTESLLSDFQKRLWYFDQLDPKTPAYNCSLIYRLTGILDFALLNKALHLVQSRNRALRTTFHQNTPEPTKLVNGSVQVSLEQVDLTDVPEAERFSEATNLYLKESERGFDLSLGPLFRCKEFRLSDKDHLLVFTIHQIIADSWSAQIIVRRLMETYSELISGQQVPYGQSPLEYEDYVLDQSGWIKSEEGQSCLQFWMNKFRTIPEPLGIPTDFPRNSARNYILARTTRPLGSVLSQNIRQMALDERSTVFAVIFAGLAALLSRLTNQDDICVGTVTPNRDAASYREIVGSIENMMAIRTDLHEVPDFRNLVRLVTKEITDALANSCVPFEVVLEHVKPARHIDRTPVFQVIMISQNREVHVGDVPGIELEPIEVRIFRSDFDLTITVCELDEEIRLVTDFSRDLFNPSSVSALHEHLHILLEDACANPGVRISELQLLTNEEKDVLINKWSGSCNTFDGPYCGVVEFFEQMADKYPEKVALIEAHEESGETLEVTYDRLNRETGLIARYLQNLGVGIGDRVALMLEPNRFNILGILGVLKAGACYVPIDTKYPEKRIEFILKDARPSVVITDRENLFRLEKTISYFSGDYRPEIFCIDRDWGEVARLPDSEIPNRPEASQAAYIIYTSGSTGRPKGVIIDHGALATFVISISTFYDVRMDDTVLQMASPSFDTSVEEIFMTLCNGASLALRSDKIIQSTTSFMAECVNLKITILDLSTAFWHQLTRALEEESIQLPHTLRMVIIGGEKALADRVIAWNSIAAPSVRLINTYGPTEATVVATAADLTYWKPLAAEKSQVPIGRPLEHVRAYILDANMNPTPHGVTGELYLGGRSLSRGYLNLPEKTALSFISNPFESCDEARLYKTGDRAKYLEDGQIEFCGRLDRQVKIRGFRVELNEIDSVLSQLPEIAEVYTMAFQKEPDPVQIIAYIIPRKDVLIDTSSLRERLGEKLPDFMVPSRFILMSEFPLNSSGKIDSSALADLEPSQQGRSDHIIAPRNSMEYFLAEIWQDVFGGKTVGVTTNFFELGGHSLLSLQIIDRVNKAGLHLSPIEFIQNPTIEAQSRIITTARPSSGSGTTECLVELQPNGSRPPIFIVHAEPGDLLGYVNLVHRLGNDQPCYGFEALGLRDVSRVHMTIEDMARFYIDEMIAFKPSPPYCLAGYCYGGLVALEMAYQMLARDIEVSMLLLIETPFPKMTEKAFLYNYTKIKGILKLGPRAWKFFALSKLRYWKRILLGDNGSDPSEELDAGVLVNRPKIYKINTEAAVHYRLKGSVPCPIRLFSGDTLEDGQVPELDELWKMMSPDLQIFVAPGSHMTILKEPGASVLAKQIRACMKEVDKDEQELFL